MRNADGGAGIQAIIGFAVILALVLLSDRLFITAGFPFLTKAEVNTDGYSALMPVSVSASSELTDSDGTVYSVQNLLDGNPETVWKAAADDKKPSVTVTFSDPISIDAIDFEMGDWSTEESYTDCARPSIITINETNARQNTCVFFTDAQKDQYLDCYKSKETAGYSFTFTVDRTYKGTKNDEISVSELTVIGKQE